MQRQNLLVPAVAAWWCLVAAGIAACGVAIGDFPFTTSSALLLVMVVVMPAAIMLALGRVAPAVTVADLAYDSDPDPHRTVKSASSSSL